MSGVLQLRIRDYKQFYAKKKTRRQISLDEMQATIPLDDFQSLISPVYRQPSAKGGWSFLPLGMLTTASLDWVWVFQEFPPSGRRTAPKPGTGRTEPERLYGAASGTEVYFDQLLDHRLLPEASWGGHSLAPARSSVWPPRPACLRKAASRAGKWAERPPWHGSRLRRLLLAWASSCSAFHCFAEAFG